VNVKIFPVFFKPGLWTVLWEAVMLMTAGCALPMGPDYVLPVPKEANPVTPPPVTPPPVTPPPSGQVPYIAEYNLQFYVPVPVAGKQPVKQVGSQAGMDVRAVWKNAGGEDITESLAVFENGLEYLAEIPLTAKNGYEFAGNIPFAYEGGMVRGQTSSDNDHPTKRTVHAEYLAVAGVSPAPPSRKVDQTDLTGHIPAPAAGEAPVSFFLAPQYFGSVQWRAAGTPAEGPFQSLTAYEAVVTLIAASGYTFTGLPANAFSHDGALSVSSGADSGAVTISFAATGAIAVENYNLQDYVPVPAAGEKAVKTVDRNELGVGVVWKDEGGADITGVLDRFALGEVYQAEIILTAKSGYVFKADQPFAYPAVTISSLSGGNSDAGSRTLTVTYNRTRAPATVTETNLAPYIPVPVTDAAPISYFTASSGQYTGSVAWKKTGNPDVHAGLFAAGTAYTAAVSLHPASGYTLDGFTGNFTCTGASFVTYDSGTRTVTVDFAETARRPITGVFDLTPYLTVPVTGAMPATGDLHLPLAPFTGKVAWKKTGAPDVHAGLFAAGTAYTATVSLEDIAAGYTLDGFTGSFIHTGAPAPPVYHPGTRAVTVEFAATVKRVIGGILSLNPYLPAPVVRAQPAAALTVPPGSPFAGAVSWIPADSIFQEGEAYTATVTLEPAADYEFAPDIAFAYVGGTVGSKSDAGGGKVAVPIAFPALTLTRVTGTDLTLPIPAPVPGAPGIVNVNAAEYTGTVTWAPGGPFVAETPYTATVNLQTRPGYTFTGVAANAFTHSKGIDSTPSFTVNGSDPTKGEVTIKFAATAAALKKITKTNLTSLRTPKAGDPLTTLITTDQYIGTVTWDVSQSGWKPAEGGFFAPSKKYRARISLAPFPGYTLDGVAANAFTHTGASSVAYSAGSTTVTVIFDSTGNIPVTDYELKRYVPIPVKGQQPVTTVDRTELSATITWKVGGAVMLTPTFAPDTVYTAVITLTAKTGYQFNFNENFSYPNADVTSQTPGSSTDTIRSVTVAYKKTDLYTVTIKDLAPYLPRPKIGEAPMPSFTTTQYAGAVQWRKYSNSTVVHTGPFEAYPDTGMEGYIAVITLTALPGYQFESNPGITYTTPDSLASGPAFSGMNGDKTQCKVTITFLRSLTPGP
jgi:hypothetical protein